MTLPSALETAARIRRGETTARAETLAALARIEAGEARVNAVTARLADRALREADEIDQARTAGRPLPPLAGVPYAVKNLFDVEGLTTLAGSKINRDDPPAARDGFLLRRMAQAGGVCVAALNMDEYAYGFTTENAHDGPTHNPHDLARVAGGSSGGSAAAIAAGYVPLTLGTDTNGSIRVPSSLCGIFGLKPTYGRLSRGGSYPFVHSLDHVGPFARTVSDLAACYDALQGEDPADPAQLHRPIEVVAPALAQGLDGLRIAIATGHFARGGQAAAFAAVARVAASLGVTRELPVDDAAEARAAAFLITMSEGAALHLPRLRTRPMDFDPGTRDRFLAGALLPAAWVLAAQKVRSRFRSAMAERFREVDVLIAPATPYPATEIGQTTIEVDGEIQPVRPLLGVFSQPISCIGLPVLTVPVWGVAGSLPIGVQLIGAPWAEASLFRVAAQLEAMGAVSAPIAPGFQ